jgi:hypothetical protein
MIITSEMFQAGTQKASELGILPRISMNEDIATNAELMMEILEAALSSVEENASVIEAKDSEH